MSALAIECLVELVLLSKEELLDDGCFPLHLVFSNNGMRHSVSSEKLFLQKNLKGHSTFREELHINQANHFKSSSVLKIETNCLENAVRVFWSRTMPTGSLERPIQRIKSGEIQVR